MAAPATTTTSEISYGVLGEDGKVTVKKFAEGSKVKKSDFDDETWEQLKRNGVLQFGEPEDTSDPDNGADGAGQHSVGELSAASNAAAAQEAKKA